MYVYHNIQYLQNASICIFWTIKIDGEEFKEEEKRLQNLWLFVPHFSLLKIVFFQIY